MAGDLYVNVHTAANPGGEIRGQIVPPNPPVVPDHTYSFENRLTADGVPCVDPHHSNTDDNIYNFDRVDETGDPFVTNTTPHVDETAFSLGGPRSRIQINTYAPPGSDLFPPGFFDNGTPLDQGCIWIGMQDAVETDVPQRVESARVLSFDTDGNLIRDDDATPSLSQPWDGRVEWEILYNTPRLGPVVVNQVEIVIELIDAAVFADGFESGDTLAWTATVE